MEHAKRLSSSICYLSGVFGLTMASDIGDILGIIVSCISAVSMFVCLIINLISTIKKAASDGKIDAEEMEEVKKQLEERKKLKNDYTGADSEEKGRGDKQGRD